MKQDSAADVPRKVALLRRAAIFADLPDEELTPIAEVAAVGEIAAETQLAEQGERPRFLYLLLDGQIGVDVLGPDGTGSVVDVREPIDLFPLAAVLTDAPHLVSARAISEATLVAIPAAAFRAIAQSHPRLAFSMLVSLSNQNRDWLRQMNDLKLLSAAQRLARYILSLGRERGADAPIALPLRKHFLASRLGTTPENLSRAFAVLREQGVATHGSQIVIGDAKRLAAFAGGDGAIDLEVM